MFFWTILCSYILIASAEEINMEAVMKSMQSFCVKLEEHGESMKPELNECFSLNPENIQDVVRGCYTRAIPGLEEPFSFFQEACQDQTTTFSELLKCFGEHEDILQNTERSDSFDCDMAMSEKFGIDMYVPTDEEPKSK
ncbi:uncharacterized protein [Parasteatoda tepidariorum]|uniref:uncharacterized protein isoform X1 n=1 Tax=Parasteatoda tepidariorum TaxID=114398 RepID=UPI00077F8B66|nr:uncharacterized protein LOC107442348 [Parasteatoda tepidariorum]